jgi:hypothetical protein
MLLESCPPSRTIRAFERKQMAQDEGRTPKDTRQLEDEQKQANTGMESDSGRQRYPA